LVCFAVTGVFLAILASLFWLAFGGQTADHPSEFRVVFGVVSRLAPFCGLMGIGRRSLALLALATGMAATGRAGDVQISSKWDKELLNVVLHDVNIKSNEMFQAFEEIGEKYLLRANLYKDVKLDSDSAIFSFKRDTATGKELMDAFVDTYPAYTYTQSPETGVIWVHRKSVAFNDILARKVLVEKDALQVPMYRGVYEPLMRSLGPGFAMSRNFISAEREAETFSHPVDLPAGIHSIREMLEYCCVAEPDQIIGFVPGLAPDGNGGLHYSIIHSMLGNLPYNNPLAPPRAAAVRYWETEIGKASNGVPGIDEIGVALADPNPRIRKAANQYLELTRENYDRRALMKTNTDAETRKTVWAVLGLKSEWVSPVEADTPYVSLNPSVMRAFTNNLAQEDPGLALLVSMELAREKKDATLMDCVAGHKFTKAEIAEIKPDVYRIARQSKLVRDKLVEMKFEAPELSPESLRALESTNYFTVMPEDTIR
jgi:hypothetical protein